ncbi:hypothetical protein ASE17_16750 [Phenylobacterium sp. Root77]|uniref:PEPxxWA-CTERM sorting domain-containing protein n=1 Tax=unclassified Phenylobacterium TaxID=2640670 RepID=UPI0006F2F946|nr:MULTISPECIES: PEPxxWA-CTERM sorting domain-containing protein [unclassified Phenylobacterium]KQW70533.1 hypothetical protein ASC73_10620 [Phenylobacterium sp. Root1277]KQW91046.1 hypothetical protein ASC79_16970 [Phenylobacterium sp. Root1290]KRC39322.1 hypothetical protein ASE17_16750 [Phenylobacterium sp. Root77]
MEMRRTFALAAAIAVLGSGAAKAATVIDVDNLIDHWGPRVSQGMGAMSYVSPDGSMTTGALQTWTVGRSGVLDQIDIFGAATSLRTNDNIAIDWDQHDFLVTLTILAGGTALNPGTIELGSVTKSALEIGAQRRVTNFDLSSLGIAVEQGDVLTFKMAVETCGGYAICHSGWTSYIAATQPDETSSHYAGGSAFSIQNSRIYSEGYAYDLNFRTWVSAVPEPSTWAMMIAGFGLTGSALRRRKRRVPSNLQAFS